MNKKLRHINDAGRLPSKQSIPPFLIHEYPRQQITLQLHKQTRFIKWSLQYIIQSDPISHDKPQPFLGLCRLTLDCRDLHVTASTLPDISNLEPQIDDIATRMPTNYWHMAARAKLV
jgi:hypothetical protein